jgi:phage FluMu protein gp41
MYLALQPGMRKGDPRSIEVAVKVLIHKSEINGYKAPAKVEMTGKQSGPLAIETLRKLCEEAEDEGVKDENSSDDTKTRQIDRGFSAARSCFVRPARARRGTCGRRSAKSLPR